MARLKGQLSDLEQAYANNELGAHYGDLLDLRELVKDVENDEIWYDAGIALAVVNAATAGILVAQQITAAALSASSYAFGFNTGLQLDIEGSKTKLNTFETSSVYSITSGNNILLKSDAANTESGDSQVLIHGSHLNASGTIAIDTDTLLVEASRDTSSTQSDTESASIHASVP